MSAMSLTELKFRLVHDYYKPTEVKGLVCSMLNRPTTKNLEKVRAIAAHVNNLPKFEGIRKTINSLIVEGLKVKQEFTVEAEPQIPPPKDYQEALTTSESDFDIMVASKMIQLKESATRRNKEFNLTLSDVKKLVKRRTCYYTGIKFDRSSELLKLTIDRIDNTKGYVKGNVVACCSEVNQIKELILERKTSPFLNNIKLLKKFVNSVDKAF